MLFTHRSFHTQHTEALYTQKKLQFYRSFWRLTIISCERVATGTRKSQFSLSLAIEPHFVRKGCAGHLQIAILLQFLAIEPRFVRKGCAGQVEIAILPQFLAIEPRFVRKGCVSCRPVGTAPAPAFRREIEKKERARGQEGKRARGQEGKRARGQEEKM